ncbi:nudix hydrolase-like protein [Dissophora ornata]|nr:nudix hydrolase-like protein [Dissophora ornata]
MSALEKPLATVKIHSEEKRGNGRWLSLHEVKFTDPSGTERSWEACRRISSRQNGAIAGAPSIDAMGTYTIEFPSGLLDGNEHASEAALRELEEEVGFSSKLGHAVKVTMEQHELFGPESVRKPKLEDDEWSLQVAIMPLQGLLKSLQDLQSSTGGDSKLVLDSRLYAWALGRELGY